MASWLQNFQPALEIERADFEKFCYYLIVNGRTSHSNVEKEQTLKILGWVIRPCKLYLYFRLKTKVVNSKTRVFINASKTSDHFLIILCVPESK